jgi:hypothetical protein
MNFLWYVSIGGLHGPAELACRTLHDLVQDAGCIFVYAQIFPGEKYLVSDFSRCLGVQLPMVDILPMHTATLYEKEVVFIY